MARKHEPEVWKRVGDLARQLRRELWLYEVCDGHDYRGRPKPTKTESKALRVMRGLLGGIAAKAKRETTPESRLGRGFHRDIDSSYPASLRRSKP